MSRFWMIIVLAAAITSVVAVSGTDSPVQLNDAKFDSYQVELLPNQYLTRAPHGQYSYGYSAPHSRKQEVRTADGVTRGAYNYVDANGVLQTVQYVADAGGFRVKATNLPRHEVAALQPVTETPEVAAARAAHLAAHAQLRSPPFPEQSKPTAADLSRPVQDTLEVAAARQAFFQRYDEELRRHELMRQLRAESEILPRPGYVLLTLPKDILTEAVDGTTSLKTLLACLSQQTQVPS